MLWQASFIVVLLAFLTAYLLDKRLGKTLFVTTTKKKKFGCKSDSIVNSHRAVKEVEQIEFIQNQTVENQNNEEQELEQEPYVEEIVFEKDDTR